MNRYLVPALIVGATLSAAMPVLAVTCYEVIDRNDTVIFRDSWTPVDLSAAGARSRAAMRERGELLVIFDAQTCLVVGRSSGAGIEKLTVDEIVAEWPDNWGLSSFRKWSVGNSSPNFGNSSTGSSGSPASAQPASSMSTKSGRY